MDTEELLKHRMNKFRKIGMFQEGLPVDSKKKVNMKMKEEPIVRTSNLNIEDEVKKLMQQRLDAKESSVELPESALNEMIEKLEREVDREYSEAVKAIGLKDRLVMLREEFSKIKLQDQLMPPVLKDKIEKLKDEFAQSVSAAPNYETLKSRLDMLMELSKIKIDSANKKKYARLKQQVNKKFVEIMNRPDMKEKNKALEDEIESSGVSAGQELGPELKEKIVQRKKEIELEMVDAIKALGLDVAAVRPKAKEISEQIPIDVKVKEKELNEEIKGEIENVIKSTDLKDKIEVLKLEVAKAGKTPNVASKNRIAALEQQIKGGLVEAMNSSNLKEKHEELQAEISKAIESLENQNPKEDPPKEDGSLENQNPKEDDSTYDE